MAFSCRQLRKPPAAPETSNPKHQSQTPGSHPRGPQSPMQSMPWIVTSSATSEKWHGHSTSHVGTYAQAFFTRLPDKAKKASIRSHPDRWLLPAMENMTCRFYNRLALILMILLTASCTNICWLHGLSKKHVTYSFNQVCFTSTIRWMTS